MEPLQSIFEKSSSINIQQHIQKDENSSQAYERDENKHFSDGYNVFPEETRSLYTTGILHEPLTSVNRTDGVKQRFLLQPSINIEAAYLKLFVSPADGNLISAQDEVSSLTV